MDRPADERLQGWREIATYLERDERTVKRWETQRGLPVRRIPGSGRAAVYALRAEVDAWLGSGAPSEKQEMPVADPVGAGATTNEGSDSIDTKQADDLRAPVAGQAGDLRAPVVGHAGFRWKEHVSLGVSLFGLALLLTATAVRFFHVGPLERILMASERMLPAEGVSRATDGTADALWLRGMYLCEKRTPAALNEARAVFEEAIARDPKFAPSYGGLAKTYLLLREYSTEPEAEAYDRAQAAAEQALALDPDLAAAHAALGFILFFDRWDGQAAEREFTVAIEQAPEDSLAHHWYGSMLMHQGRYAEALAQLDVAQHLTPTSPAILASRALAVGLSGRRDEGMRLLRAMERGDGRDAMVHRNLSFLALMEPRDTGEFLRESREFATMRGDVAGAARMSEAEATFARRGEPAAWEELLAGEKATHTDQAHPSYLMAEAEAVLGHENAAMGKLEVLARERDPQMIGLVVEPAFRPLHKEEAFVQMAERLGLGDTAMETR